MDLTKYFQVNWEGELVTSTHYVPSLETIPTKIRNEIEFAAKCNTLCPPLDRVFRAFEATPLDEVKVVILGQDPYHTPGKASGLAFGYHPAYDRKIDSSLANIYREIERDLGRPSEVDRTLEDWAYQGVLLLNTRLTTLTRRPLAHKDLGWEREIEYFIDRIQDTNSHMVFMLWGGHAQKYKNLVREPYNLVLSTSHPCGMSVHRGFRGCGHFSAANEFLVNNGRKPITW